MSPAALLLTFAVSQGPLPPDLDAPFMRGAVSVDGASYGYRLLAPPSPAEGARYPLVLFLHGSGERGDDNTKQLTHFPRRIRKRPGAGGGFERAQGIEGEMGGHDRSFERFSNGSKLETLFSQ